MDTLDADRFRPEHLEALRKVSATWEAPLTVLDRLTAEGVASADGADRLDWLILNGWVEQDCETLRRSEMARMVLERLGPWFKAAELSCLRQLSRNEPKSKSRLYLDTALPSHVLNDAMGTLRAQGFVSLAPFGYLMTARGQVTLIILDSGRARTESAGGVS